MLKAFHGRASRELGALPCPALLRLPGAALLLSSAAALGALRRPCKALIVCSDDLFCKTFVLMAEVQHGLAA